MSETLRSSALFAFFVKTLLIEESVAFAVSYALTQYGYEDLESLQRANKDTHTIFSLHLLDACAHNKELCEWITVALNAEN